MLWRIAAILLVLWLIGLLLHVRGALIQILLVLAVIVFPYNPLIGRRGAL